MIRIAVCDDDTFFLNGIRDLIDNYPKSIEFTIDCFDDGDSLIKAHTKKPYDIIFLDIVMPLFSGLEVAKEIREQDKSTKIIFLTTSTDYAVESYTVKATNYLLKPLDKEKFYACLSELFDEFSKEEPSLLIKSLSTTRHVLLSEIEYIEAQNRYTMLYLNNGKSVRTPKPLYAFEDKLTLENGFYKCHRSYIINLFRVDSYTSIDITMRSGSKIPLSRSYNTEFKETYFNHVCLRSFAAYRLSLMIWMQIPHRRKK